MSTSRNPWTEDGVTEANVVIPQQDQISVYRNERGEVVIRQRSWPDDDALIILAPEHAKALADAILRCADALLHDDDRGDDDQPAPAPRPTNAERQRRYRERRRQGVTRDRNATVTPERNASVTRNGGLVDLPFSPPIDGEEEEALAS